MNESQFQQRLKSAVQSVEAPPDLHARIRTRVSESPARSWGFWLVPSGVAATLCAGVLGIYHLGYLRLTASSRESYISSVSARVAMLMRVGLGDHIHCAVFRKYPKNPPSVEKLESDLGPEYRGLVPVVRRYVSADYRLMLGHRCEYHGQGFIHLAFRNDAHLVSLVIARKGDGESFEAQGLLPALVQSGIPVYQATTQRFEMSAFESRDFLVYLISDLSAPDNQQMMLAMAAPVKELLELR